MFSDQNPYISSEYVLCVAHEAGKRDYRPYDSMIRPVFLKDILWNAHEADKRDYRPYVDAYKAKNRNYWLYVAYMRPIHQPARIPN